MPFTPKPAPRLGRGHQTLAQAADKVAAHADPRGPPPLAPLAPFMRGPPDAREAFTPPGHGGEAPGMPSFADPPPATPPMAPPQMPGAVEPATPAAPPMMPGSPPMAQPGGNAMAQQLLQALALRRRGAQVPGMGSPGIGAGFTPGRAAPGAVPGEPPVF